jgi:hypothetical protein
MNDTLTEQQIQNLELQSRANADPVIAARFSEAAAEARRANQIQKAEPFSGSAASVSELRALLSSSSNPAVLREAGKMLDAALNPAFPKTLSRAERGQMVIAAQSRLAARRS